MWQKSSPSCWWLKSWTTWDVWNPVDNGVFTVWTGDRRISSINSTSGPIWQHDQSSPEVIPMPHDSPWKSKSTIFSPSQLPETHIFAPENGWLEDDPFLFGGKRPPGRCEVLVSGSDFFFKLWDFFKLGGGNSKIFDFYPDPWRNDPIWLIFFKWVETTN